MTTNVSRNFRGERDYWLDHYGQWCPTRRRPKGMAASVTERDYIAIPTPHVNLPTPLAGACLAWRWGISGKKGGYGRLGRTNELVHRLAWRQSRDAEIPEGQNVLHLCSRPFCVQPAHLYVGSAQDNSDDHHATYRHGLGAYRTWEKIGEKWDKAFEAGNYAWPNPQIVHYSPRIEIPPLACPCNFIALKSSGDWVGCVNCGLSAPGTLRPCHKPQCRIEGDGLLCRCKPCQCKWCVLFRDNEGDPETVYWRLRWKERDKRKEEEEID